MTKRPETVHLAQSCVPLQWTRIAVEAHRHSPAVRQVASICRNGAKNQASPTPRYKHTHNPILAEMSASQQLPKSHSRTMVCHFVV